MPQRKGEASLPEHCEVHKGKSMAFLPIPLSLTTLMLEEFWVNLHSFYFSSPQYPTFHDLTHCQCRLKLSNSVLGPSHKFIPVLKVTPHVMDANLDRFERDVHLKVYFAMQPMGNKPPKLYVKSKWRPPSNVNPNGGGSVPTHLL